MRRRENALEPSFEHEQENAAAEYENGRQIRIDLPGLPVRQRFLFVIILPYLGVLVYLIARGGKMTDREVADVQASNGRYNAAPAAAPASSTADELSKLAALHERGVLTDAEFAAQKASVLK